MPSKWSVVEVFVALWQTVKVIYENVHYTVFVISWILILTNNFVLHLNVFDHEAPLVCLASKVCVLQVDVPFFMHLPLELSTLEIAMLVIATQAETLQL